MIKQHVVSGLFFLNDDPIVQCLSLDLYGIIAKGSCLRLYCNYIVEIESKDVSKIVKFFMSEHKCCQMSAFKCFYSIVLDADGDYLHFQLLIFRITTQII